MTSDARNSQIPSLPLASPVSGRVFDGVRNVHGLRALRLELRREVLRRRPARCTRTARGTRPARSGSCRAPAATAPTTRAWSPPTGSCRPASPHLMLAEEVEDERQLEQRRASTPPCRSTTCHLQQTGVVRVLHAAVVQPAVHAGQALDEHRHEDDVDADERAPEVDLAEQLVHLPAGRLREPVVDARRTARRSSPAPRRSGSGR